jgi:type IV pilus assembly protein PilB
MTTPLKRFALEDVLVKHGLIVESEKDQLLQEAQSAKKPLHSLLLEKGAVAEPLMAQALADQYNLPWNPLEDYRVDSSFFETIPVEWMHRYPFVPMSQENGSLTIAIANPQDVRAIDELELLLGCELNLVVSTATAINEALADSEGNKQVLSRIQAELDPVLVKEDDKGEEDWSILLF